MPVETTTFHAGSAATSAWAARRSRASAVLAATVAAVLGWLVIDPLLGVDLTVQTAGSAGARDVGPVAVTVAGLVSGLAGWALLLMLERLTTRARTVWRSVALVTFALSMVGAFDAVTTAATAGLAALHVIVGGTLFVLLPRTTQR